MKKSIILIISLLTFLFFSCATNDVSLEDNLSPNPENILNNTEENENSTLPDSEQKDLENSLSQELETLNEEQSLVDLDNQMYVTTITDELEQESESDSVETEENNNIDIQESMTDNSEITPSENDENFVDPNIQNELTEIEEPEVFDLEPPEEIIIPETPILEEEISESELIEIQPEDSDDIESIEEDSINISEIGEIDEVDEVVSLEEESNVDDVIEITDDDSQDSMESEFIDKEIIVEPSRTVTLKKLEYLDVTYPGKGWIFMGLTDNSKDITYFGRKVNSTDTKFSLQAKNSGTKILHFYKEDALTNDYIDDFIEVIITEEKGSSKTHIEAPKYIPQLKKIDTSTKNTKSEDDSQKIDVITKTKTEDKKQSESSSILPASNNTQPEPKTVESNPTENPSSSDKEDLLNANNSSKNIDSAKNVENNISLDLDLKQLFENAKNSYNEKDYKKADEYIKLYLELSTEKKDAALYLQGQIFEAESSFQDIPKAIEAYTMLINNYPVSTYWDKANKRIIYLKRFYMEGR